MFWLLLASVIWAFSFGLIKGLIVGLDPFFMGAIRMTFAFALSLFCWRPLIVAKPRQQGLAVAGFFQLGLMYAPYLVSFRYLKAHEVALFTMTTPIIVVAVHQFAERTFSLKLVIAALISILGGSVVAFKQWEWGAYSDMVVGIILVQLANLLFAVGQYIYARVSASSMKEQLYGAPFYFGGAFLGAALVCGIALAYGMKPRALTSQEWAVLAYLGIVASGLGFAIWNYGVSHVNYGVLAVASDFKLPIAILVSLTIFGEQAHLLQLASGIVILWIAAVIAR